MAAYASLVSLSQTIEQFLHHEYIHHRLPTTLVGDLRIESLQEHVNFLQAFLDDSLDDKATTDLEGRIKDASDVVEYTLEYFMSGSEDLQTLAPRSKDVADTHYDNSKRPAPHKLAFELQEAAKNIGSIVGEVTDIKNSTVREESGDSSSSRLPPSIGKDEIMVGFDDDLLAIKSLLCGNSSRLEIIPICGMGGIGKTTLTRKAYEDPSTVHRFQIRAWVTVSRDYEAEEVLSRLHVSMKAFIGERKGQGDEIVYKSLKGMRYLIVLDDMWSTEVWDNVKRLFPDDNNGSRILLTTRLVDVAVYADSSSNLYQMHLMGEDRSWQLLQQKVFKEEQCPPQLEDIGMTIAGRCKGLPLAIVVVAGILSTISPTNASWEKVARKVWTAEGFMKARGSKCFEDVAEEYLEDLVKRSLVLVKRRKRNGRIKSCSIHDLLRELCIRKAGEENFLIEIFTRSKFYQRKKNLIEQYVPTVHSVLVFHFYHKLNPLKKFRLLRVLDGRRTFLREFPDYVLELYLLRYLSFSLNCGLRESDVLHIDVPPSISKLQNLQTLLIRPALRSRFRGSTVRFPSEIWSMRRLRHLHVGGGVAINLPEPYSTPFALQDLQTLSTVRNFRCTERVLQMIQNVKKLGIVYEYEAVPGGLTNLAKEYHVHNLVRLLYLEKLSIHVIGPPAPVPELRFPTMLKKLKSVGFQRLSKQVMGNFGSLPNLEVLKLHYCNFEDDMWETTEGEFPKLKVLQIMHTLLKEWITERSHFPRLKHLHLSGCDGLREIPEEIGEIPTLELIQVDGFAKRSLFESAERIKEEQQSYGNDSLQVWIKEE